MTAVAPDDMIVGQFYAFDYMTHDGKERATCHGEFRGMVPDKIHRALWFVFKWVESGRLMEIPFEYTSLGNLRTWEGPNADANPSVPPL